MFILHFNGVDYSRDGVKIEKRGIISIKEGKWGVFGGWSPLKTPHTPSF
jgi:hypothetical protein